MSNDFTPINPTDNDAPMFAGVPSWERGKKRRTTFGKRVAAEPRSFAPEYAAEPGDAIPTRPVTLSDDARAYEARMDTVDPTDTTFADPTFAGGATFADRTSRKGNGAMPIMVAAGIILVGGLAAGGWYATQPHNAGVAQLTPGSAATTTTTEVAATAPLPGEQQIAQAAPAPAPVRSTTTTTTTAPKAAVSHTTVTRVAPARSAATVGVNASTAAPMPVAPAPTPAPPAAAAPPAPLVLTLPPQAAPPATTAPAETPLPTQTAPAPPPTQTPPSR
jgi:hypothetical protein